MRPAALLFLLAAAAAGAQQPDAIGLGPRHQPGTAIEEGERPRLKSLIDGASDSALERDGTLSWRVLGDISTIRHENTDGKYGPFIAYFAEPVVRSEVKALEGRTVRVRGYVLPRLGVEGLTRILVSALPAADADGCASGGPETFVDAIVRGPVSAGIDALVTVEGRLALFRMDRWAGYIYRLEDARVVEEGKTP